ncbi:MAG: ABC transporter permease [Oscillospiraceae bacterium]|jgi:peptide/nickel transport system permease protein|nr:ABC transporter permease [Oscillospiraceae bacterium]
MWKTVIRRLLILIPQLVVLSLFIFFIAQYMPGDALTGKSVDPNADPQRLEELRQQWGFYDPWYVKYVRWVGNIFKGDLGRSYTHQVPVTQVISDRAGNTFWLGLMTVFFQYLISIPLGILSGRYHDKIPDRAITLYSYVALAMPTVVACLLSIFTFSFGLKWFPFGGTISIEAYAAGGIQAFLSRIHHMILPALTVALISTTSITQFLRSEIVDYEQSDFVTTARSKGVPKRVIYSRHIFRNSMIPVSSFMGYSIVGVLTGAIFTESVFGYPGMGKLFIDSVFSRDYTVVNALIIFFAILTVLGTLLSDVIMSLVDPRLKVK